MENCMKEAGKTKTAIPGPGLLKLHTVESNLQNFYWLLTGIKIASLT